MKFLITLILPILLCSTAQAEIQEKDFKEVFRSVVRVDSKEGVGSGFIFDSSENAYFILTNYHVVGEDDEVEITLNRDGFMSPPFKVDTVYKTYKAGQRDLAILKLNSELLGDYKPAILPLTKYDSVDYDRKVIYTAGFPQGQTNPTMFQGNLLDHKEGLEFTPPPYSGRSGSPIIGETVSGHYVAIGIIGWKTENTGLGMNIYQIYSALKGETVSIGEPLNDFRGQEVQYVEECPDGKCWPFDKLIKKDREIHPNNPWYKVPGPPNQLSPPKAPEKVPAPTSDFDKRLTKLEKDFGVVAAGQASLEAKIDGLLKKVDGAVTKDSLNNYATRDQLGNYVTVEVAEGLVNNYASKTVNDKLAPIEAKTEKNFNALNLTAEKLNKQSERQEANLKNQDSRLASFGERVEKLGELATTVAKVSAWVPPFAPATAGLTLGGVALTGIGAFLGRKGRKGIKKKLTKPKEIAGPATEVDSPAVKEIVKEIVKEVPVVKEVIKEVEVPKEIIKEVVKEVPVIHEVPGHVKYTMPPKTDDFQLYRQAIELATRNEPSLGPAAKFFEQTFELIKSGVKK